MIHFCGVDLDDCWDPVDYKIENPFLEKVLDDLKVIPRSVLPVRESKSL